MYAIFHRCRVLVTAMQGKSEGAIVFVSSAAGVRGCKNALAFSVANGVFCNSLAASCANSLTPAGSTALLPALSAPGFGTTVREQMSANHRIPLHLECRHKMSAELISTLVRNDYLPAKLSLLTLA